MADHEGIRLPSVYDNLLIDPKKHIHSFQSLSHQSHFSLSPVCLQCSLAHCVSRRKRSAYVMVLAFDRSRISKDKRLLHLYTSFHCERRQPPPPSTVLTSPLKGSERRLHHVEGHLGWSEALTVGCIFQPGGLCPTSLAKDYSLSATSPSKAGPLQLLCDGYQLAFSRRYLSETTSPCRTHSW